MISAERSISREMTLSFMMRCVATSVIPGIAAVNVITSLRVIP